jgi:chemotaxis protein methyltransferase CheR
MTAAHDAVAVFRALVQRHLGLVFDHSKHEMLAAVLHRRARARALSPAAFLDSLDADPGAETGPLASELTVGETYFFRNPAQFAAFREVVLPARARSSEPLRILSAGCSSGDEAYTIAMVLCEQGIDGATIRAVDANPDVLRRATEGRYSAWSLRATSPEIQRTWFREDGRDLVLDPRIRAAVTFEQRNLAVDDPTLWAADSYDVIFCRNVIMYFTPQIMAEVVARITRALRPGGYLFLGHAETLRGLTDELALCHSHNTFYYQRGGERQARVDAYVPSLATAAPLPHDDGWVASIRQAADRVRALSANVPSEATPARSAWDAAAAHALLETERFADALALVDAWPPEAAADPETLLLRAVLLAHCDQLAAAQTACDRLLEIPAFRARAHHVLALCRESAGDIAAAIEHDRAATYLDPTFAMARLHLGLLARRTGDVRAARDELARARVLLAQEPPAHLLLFAGGFKRNALVSLCEAELERVR